MQVPTALLSALRPAQWIKSLFILAPAFFGGVIMEQSTWLPLLVAFVSFSFVSSSIYLINDVVDKEKDRLHPTKRSRPIASGAVPIPLAITTAILLLVAALGLSCLAPQTMTVHLTIIGGYWLLNIVYCFFLKQIAVVDVVTISIGFVLRVLLGGVSVGVPVSEWLLIMTFLLCLFLALAKRRDDLLLYKRSGEVMRSSIKYYSRKLLDRTLILLAATLLVCYLLYTLSPQVRTRPGCDLLYLSTLPVLVGLLRYLQIIFVAERSGSPTQIVLSDPIMILSILAWGVVYGGMRYLLFSI